MNNVIPLSRIVTVEEHNSLKNRVQVLEAALAKVLDRSMANFSEDEEIKSRTASFYADKLGISLGASVDPIDLYADPTRNGITREFSILECPKASVPTKERIETEYGPLINFKIADEFQHYCRMSAIEIKDGPYIDLLYPKHDVGLKYTHLHNWILERLQRPGADSPYYIDLITNFIDGHGKLVESNIFGKIGLLSGLYGMAETVAAASPDSSVGISFQINDLCSTPMSPRLRSAGEFIKKALESGIPLQYVGLKMTLDVQQRIDPNVTNINLDYLDQTGIPEIHLTNILISNNSDVPDAFPAAVHADLIGIIGTNELISVMSMASPRTIVGYCEGLFDDRMLKTASYEAVRRSLWSLAR